MSPISKRWLLLGLMMYFGVLFGRADAENFRVSLSVSPYTESMFRLGFTFTDGTIQATNPEQLQRLFVAHGANEVYARIGTRRKQSPGDRRHGADHSVERGLERARLAKTLGLPFNPELGLFATYGDVRLQPPPDFSEYPQIKLPGEWTSLRLDQMLPALRSYGAIIAREILDTGVQVRIWDLGNEVEFGVAGVALGPDPEFRQRSGYKPPDAVDPEIGQMSIRKINQLSEEEQVAWLKKHLWPANARMFAAVAQGIRSVDPGARFSTHVSGVTVRPKVYVAYFKAMKKGGYLPDELGFSYYPTNDMGRGAVNRLHGFKEMATAAHRELGRPVFIAEYAYAAGDRPIGLWENLPVKGYPLTPGGQADFLRDLVAWGTQEGILSGIRPWAPELVTGWEPMALFSAAGKTATARPALKSIVTGSSSNARQ